jgi:hypothetical protein
MPSSMPSYHSALRYEYELIFDDEVVAHSNGTTAIHYFGDESACTESPSISTQPTRSPSNSPSLEPTTSTSPSLSPSTSTQPTGIVTHRCNRWYVGDFCDPRCAYKGSYCCCCHFADGTVAAPTQQCRP